MYELPPAFVIESAKHIMERSGVSTPRLTMGYADNPMDCATLEFLDGHIHASIAQKFASEERFLTFIIQYYQGVMPYFLRTVQAWPDIRGNTYLWLDDVSHGPGLGFTTGTHENQFGVPDPMFVRSDGYQSIRALFPANWVLWRDRQDIVFWRGATTGYPSSRGPHWRNLPRIHLCAVARAARDPSLFDIGINKIVQIGDPRIVDEITGSGLMKDTVPQEASLRYRYNVDIDGNANSWPGLFTKMLMQNTIFKIASERNYRQWYYDELLPWVHYIPVDCDLETLEERAVWARRHPEQSYYMAANAFRFARALTLEQAIADTGPKLRDYLNRTDREAP